MRQPKSTRMPKLFGIRNEFNSVSFVIDKKINKIRYETDNNLYDIEITAKTAHWLAKELILAAEELENK